MGLVLSINKCLEYRKSTAVHRQETWGEIVIFQDKSNDGTILIGWKSLGNLKLTTKWFA